MYRRFHPGCFDRRGNSSISFSFVTVRHQSGSALPGLLLRFPKGVVGSTLLEHERLFGTAAAFRGTPTSLEGATGLHPARIPEAS